MESAKDDDNAEEVTAHSSNACTSSLTFCKPPNSETKSVKLWKRALHKVQSTDYLDPWVDFPTHTIQTRSATRHRYSVIRKKWVVDQIEIKMERIPFDHGAMRECYRLKKMPQSGIHSGDWQYASNYVAKRYITDVPRQVYFDDVRLQMEAKLWGEAYNRQNPPKKVDIFQLSVLELENPIHLAPEVNIGSKSESTCLHHIERFMEGEYRKYNSNSGFVDDQLRNTPHAFSHFTFERSGHRLLVVDIQGVGDLYTDPQIHTSDGVGYSDGNLGPRGMAFFFHSHRCNPLCEFLGLTPFDLAPSELLENDYQQSPQFNDDAACDPQLSNGAGAQYEQSTHIPQENHPKKYGQVSTENRFKVPSSWKFSKSLRSPRRRSISFSQHTSTSSPRQHGPTVARSTEDMFHGLSLRYRRRCDSSSICSEIAVMNPIDGHYVENYSRPHLASDGYDSPLHVKLDNKPSIEQHLPTRDIPSHPSLYTMGHGSKPLYTLDGVRQHIGRNRTSSGDSGYSAGRVANLISPLRGGGGDYDSVFSYNDQHFFPDNANHPNLLLNSNSQSTHSLFDYTIVSPSSDVDKFGAAMFRQLTVSDDRHRLMNRCGIKLPSDENLSNAYCGTLNHLPFGRLRTNSGGGCGLLSRRLRNMSESSDLDVEEDHRNTGNLLHQLMHENHKPSCADHPTNLDQEIGQSILGQIHHELARLHEAGRFLPEKEGGWSLRETDFSDLPSGDVTDVHQSVDWNAILFHELHAAQLGCLEAMIVMAHYYLGLPTQLLLDCPVKPDPGDVRSGVDYLWRAAEGGDRRCMILLARYLDISVTLSDPTQKNCLTSCLDGTLVFPTLQVASLDVLPSAPPDAWVEAISWYQRAVDTAGAATPSDGTPDEGLDAEGRYDAAEDLLPVYKILARMAEMKLIGGHGLKQDYNYAGDLFSQAGELASSARQGRLAAKYFELSEDAYGKVD